MQVKKRQKQRLKTYIYGMKLYLGGNGNESIIYAKSFDWR